MNSNTSPARLRLLGEEGIVDLVHGGEVLHVGEEDVDFDHVVDAASCCFEDFGQVGQGLFLLALAVKLVISHAFYFPITEAVCPPSRIREDFLQSG